MFENEMSIQEFISQPTTVGLLVPSVPFIKEIVKEKPYIRLGKNLGINTIIYVSRDYIAEMALIFSVTNIYMFPNVLGLLGEVDLDVSGIIQVHNQPYLDLYGSNVLLGFVDTGIDYANDAFRYEDGSTRVQYIWDQSIDGDAPDGYFFGSEYDANQINLALQNQDPSSIISHEDSVGHGTFLASVAGGRTQKEIIGAAFRSEFIVVKLKKASPFFINRYLVPEEQYNVYESTDLMLGIQYLVEKAETLGRPISICIGIGTNFGGHDGNSKLDEYLDVISLKPGACLCMAAGNESQANHHASGKLTEQGEEVIDISVADSTKGFMTTIISNFPDQISISIISPSGEVVGPIKVKEQATFETKLIFERVTLNVEYYIPIEIRGAQLTIVRLIHPIPGIWKLIVHGDMILDGNYNAWLPMTGLVSPGIEFVKADPYTTITTPSATISSVSCGAYNSRTGTLYLNSSWGPTRLSLMAPDLVAPGVNVRGIYPTGYGDMTGTSVAAAITAGACALMLEWGIVQNNDHIMNASRIRSYLIRGCTRDPNLVYPNYQWGYGNLNLYKTFQMLRPN